MKQGQKLEGAKIKNPVLYRIFNAVFIAVFVLIILLCIFANTNTFAAFRWYWLLLAAAAGVAVVFAISRLWNKLPPFSKTAEVITVCAMLAVLIAAQGFVGYKLRVMPTATWDFGLVFNYASDYVNTGALPDDYFLRCTNNTGVYALFCGFFSLLKVFGISDFTLPSMVLNIFAIDLSILLLYFCGRRLFGTKRAVFLLLCCYFTLPFLLYVPVYYTDTLTLPFPIGVVLLWLRARAHWREGRTRKAYGLFLAATALAAVGSLLKMSVIIVWVAIAIDLAIFLHNKKRFIMLLVGALLATGLVLGGNAGLRNIPMLPKYDYSKGMPLNLWVYMGFKGGGGYNDEAFQLALTKDTKAERQQLINEYLADELYKKGPLGTAQYLGTKLSFTFGDGTYFAASKLDRNPAQPNALHEFVVHTGRYFVPVAYAAFAAEMAMLIWLTIAAVKSFFRKNQALTFVRVAIFGLTLFLLVWETRSRYLINFLPLFLLAAAEAAPMPRRTAVKNRAKQAALAGAAGTALQEEADAEDNPDTQIDENGVPYYYDEDGRPYYLDDDGRPFSYDENGQPYFLEEGEPEYYDHGQLYYVGEGEGDYSFNEDGQPIFVGEGEGEYCYTEEDVLYDEEGRQYAFDENGEAYYIEQGEAEEDAEENKDSETYDAAPVGETTGGFVYDENGQLNLMDADWPPANGEVPLSEEPAGLDVPLFVNGEPVKNAASVKDAFEEDAAEVKAEAAKGLNDTEKDADKGESEELSGADEKNIESASDSVDISGEEKTEAAEEQKPEEQVNLQKTQELDWEDAQSWFGSLAAGAQGAAAQPAPRAEQKEDEASGAEQLNAPQAKPENGTTQQPQPQKQNLLGQDKQTPPEKIDHSSHSIWDMI